MAIFRIVLLFALFLNTVVYTANAFDLGGVFDIVQSARQDLLGMEKYYYKKTPVQSVIKGSLGTFLNVGPSGKILPSGQSLKFGGVSKALSKSTIRRFKAKTKSVAVTTKKVAHRNKFKVQKVKGATLNKHYQAINQIERSIYEAAAMTKDRGVQELRKVNMFKRSLVAAVRSGHYAFARQAYGHLIYHAAALKQGRKGKRRRRQTSSATKSTMDEIRNQIGPDQFAKMMALGGDATLAFAFDTTGSMSDDLVGAKTIARAIVNVQRDQDVDYILSPFSDPISAFAPIQYFPEDQKGNMLTALSLLKANGGGDCPELVMHGLQRIYTNSIKLGSPIYVFTDAGPKDYDEHAIDELHAMVDFLETPVNFLISRSSCLKREDGTKYESIVNATGGEMLFFGKGSELGKMSNYIDNSLLGGSKLPVLPQKQTLGRKRRQISNTNEYAIIVDNTITTLTTSVSVAKKGPSINFFRPDGTIEVTGKEEVGFGVIYVVKNPPSGTWKLTVGGASSVNTITAKGISSENIDFDFSFMVNINRGRRGKIAVSSKYPLEDTKNVPVIVSLSSAASIDFQSLQLRLTTRSFDDLGKVRLTPKGSPSLGRFEGAVNIPKRDFLLMLEGKTKDGKTFKRLSRGDIRTTTLIARIIKGRNGFTIARGNALGTSLMVAVHNFGDSEHCSVKLIDRERIGKGLIRNQLFVRKGAMAFLPVRFAAPGKAKPGSVLHAVLSVKGIKSGKKARLLISLLVV